MISKTGTKKIWGSMVGILLMSLYFVPILVDAVEDPETVGKTGITYECLKGECTFTDLVTATLRVVDWARDFALVFSVVVIAVAGFKYMISGDMPDERKKANDMFVSVLWGIFYIMSAWLIIHLITSALLKPDISNLI